MIVIALSPDLSVVREHVTSIRFEVRGKREYELHCQAKVLDPGIDWLQPAEFLKSLRRLDSVQ